MVLTEGLHCLIFYSLTGGEETDIEDNVDLSNGFVIRDRDPNPELPETVTQLDTPWGSKVYVVGTAHFSQESQEDVAKVKIKHVISVLIVQHNYLPFIYRLFCYKC